MQSLSSEAVREIFSRFPDLRFNDAAPHSHAFSRNGSLSTCLPAYSDRITQDFNLIPFYSAGAENSIRLSRLTAGAAGLNAAPAQPCRSLCRRGDWRQCMLALYTRKEQQKNRTDWDLRPIMSCLNTTHLLHLQGTYHSLVRRIRYVLIRQVF